MIDKANVKNIYRLSPVQGGMLFHTLYEGEKGLYFEQGTYRLDGPLHLQAFEDAWNAVVDRHDALRTAFVVKGVPEPLQIVLKERPLEFTYRDLSQVEESDARTTIAAFRAKDKSRGFDLSKDRLLRISLFRLTEETHIMVMSFHHIVMDGWCQGILAHEFVTAYQDLAADRQPRLPAAPQYRDFVRWLERQDKDRALNFWKEQLERFRTPTYFPRRQDSGTAHTGSTGQQQNRMFALSEQETSALTSLASGSGVTLGTVIQTLWGILLGKLNGTDDAVFLSIVSGRPVELPNAENIVGLFINAIPVRVRSGKDEQIADICSDLHRRLGESNPYQFAPLAEIQASSPLKRDLANSLLVFENYPFASAKDEGPFTITQEDIDERTNYDLTLQIHPGTELGFGVAFDPDVIVPETINIIEQWFRGVAAHVADHEGTTVGELDTVVPARTPAAQSASHPLKPVQIVLTSTFTAEPVLPALRWWLRGAGYSPDVTVAEYNQVFQQLLDPESSLARCEGYGLLAVRFEDWIRDFGNEAGETVIRHLHATYNDYVQALQGFAGSSVLIHMVLPSDLASLPENVAEAIRELHQKIVKDGPDNGVAILDARNLAEQYALETAFDPIADSAGHVPYTPEASAAIGTSAARKIFSRTQHAFKVIAVDCDNTLWDGIVGEDGPEGCQVFGGYRVLQEFLVERYREGYLIVLNSKNNENDVWEVFDNNPDMILRRAHVVAWRINWKPKSGNLKEMAEELNLGLNSFLFIDDSGMECAEVRENAPEALTVRVPKNHQAIPRLLQHLWALDKWQVTDEDRKRSEMYRAERGRQQEQSSATSLEDFLKSLELRISMAPVAPHQIPRFSQLTQRTNQFNISTVRRDENQIRELAESPDHICWVVTVADRFGEYGIVGALICRRQEQTLIVDTLLLSCRVLGRGVEDAILTGMRNYAEEYGLEQVEALFIPTRKNAPALRFLETWPGEREESENGDIWFRRSVESLPDGVPFGEYEYRTEPFPATPDIPAESATKTSAPGSAKHAQPGNSHRTAAPSDIHHQAEIPILDIPEKELQNYGQLQHRFYYLPLLHSTGKALAMLPDPEMATPSATPTEARTAYVAPSTQEEHTLAELFREVLRVENPGMHDNFFDLGGHSLSAVELLSKVHRAFGTEISLRAIFDNPTPATLLQSIQRGQTKDYQEIEALPKLYHYDLSHAQRRLWVLDNIQSEGASYVMGGANRLGGKLDVDALERAVHSMIRRHESLRTGIILVHGEPRQRVFDDAAFSIEHIDLSGQELSPEQLTQRASDIIREREAQRFNLSEPPLLRATLIKLAENDHILALFMHHIIGDGWSYPIFVHELVTLYREHLEGKEEPGSQLPPLRIQYKDYAAWQKQWLESNEAREDEEYWLKSLAGSLPVLSLPTDFPRSANQNYEGATHRIALDDAELATVRTVCKAEGTTLFMFLLTSVRSLLWNYTRQRDIIVGTPVAGRDHPDLADQIGFFVNTLPLRSTVDPERPFAAALRATREEILEAFSHASYPFDLIVGKLEGLERNTGRSPVFDVMVALQNNRDAEDTVEGLEFHPFGEEAGAGKFDLVFNFSETQHGLSCLVEYRSALFRQETIARIADNLRQTILNAGNAPGRSLQDIVLPSDQVLACARTVAAAPAPDNTLVEAFHSAATQYAGRTALVAGGQHISYSELHIRAEHIARALVSRGIRKGQIVAGIMRRGQDLVAAMLGAMKAGALWLPMDPSWPESRIAMILEDSSAALAIVDDKDGSTTGCPHISPKELLEDIGANAENIELPPIAPDNSAYVIYTSGSTGKPKGVRVGHRSFLHMILHQITTFGVNQEDVVLQFASPAFDASLSEMFMALLSGACLVLPDMDELKDTDAFLHLMESTGITVATIPPVYLRALNLHPMSGLRSLITAGEEAPIREVLFYASQGINVFNAYGPTECSVCATIHRVDPNRNYNERIPIGHPLPGTGFFVGDENLRPLPHGGEGELIIFGNGLAQDYLGREDLTDQHFIHPTWLPETRCYRTGDRVQLNAEGELVFLGRIDEQVKIRGHRVEPEEVRIAILEYPGVRDAAVIPAGETGNRQMVSFVCGDPGIQTGKLLTRLAEQLPPYLVPHRTHIVDALPITSNGKVDRAKLAAMDRSLIAQSGTTDTEATGPRTTEEAVLAKTFSEVLSREVRNIHDNFFTLGGDSIKAIQMRGALRRHGYEVRSRDIYEGQTIEGIAPHLQELGQNGGEELYVDGEEFTTPIVTWFSERLQDCDAERFILPLVVDSKQRIDISSLEQTLTDLQLRHPALRMTAQCTDGRISLRTAPTSNPNPDDHSHIEILDLTDNPELFHAPGSVINRLARHFSFDGQSPLYRIAVLRGPEHDTIAFVLHHLAVDAISQQILLNDLNLAYAARMKGQEPVFGMRSASFGAWAGSLANYASSISAEDQRKWEELAADVRQAPDPLGTIPTLAGSPARSGQIAIEGEHARHILNARRRGIDVHHVLLAALAETFAELSGNERLAVLMESHGRGGDQQVDLTESIGWFTAVYPVMLRAAGAASILDSIKRIRTALNDIQGREAEYGTLLYSTADNGIQEDLKASPQISFNYLGEHSTPSVADLSRLFSFTNSTVEYESFTLNPFEINAIVTDGVIRLNWSVAPGIPETIENQFEEVFAQQISRITDVLQTDHAEIRMICMPVAGSTTRTFDALANVLPDTFETIALELPGHGARIDREPLDRVPEIVDDLLAQMAEYRDKPYILFGHSLGALLGFEIVRRIVATGEKEQPLPHMIVCSGAPAPFHLKYGEMMSELPDYEFIRAYHLESVRRGETPPTGTMLEKMIVATRADYVAVENYHYEEAASLPIPLVVLRGSDEYIVMEMVMDWEKEAGAGMTLREIRGGHEYPFENPGETADTIVEELLKTGDYARQLIS